MIVTVSTVKDHLPNIQRFVRGNLSGGVDHMIVFMDAPDDEVEEWLSAQEHVSVVVTDDSWWGERRPKRLNRRQILNANLAKAVLAKTSWGTWIFHIDADEVARIDREVLDAVPRKRKAARLTPLEVVSQLHPDGEPQLFKRRLKDGELHLLLALGLITEPDNAAYFRSHTVGKVGVRPKSRLSLGIHKAMDREGERHRTPMQPGLEVLHYEAYSGEDFVRKWDSMVSAGPGMNFGEHRLRLATAFACLLKMEVEESVRTRLLTQLYQEHMEDDVATLDDLGFLRRVDIYAAGQTPRSTTAHAAELRELLESVRTVPKADFHPRREMNGESAEESAGEPDGRPTRERAGRAASKPASKPASKSAAGTTADKARKPFRLGRRRSALGPDTKGGPSAFGSRPGDAR